MSDSQEIVLKPGDSLGGRYVILEEIGRGGFGVVYRAVQEGVNRHVALKTLKRNIHAIPGYDFAEAFRKEARHTSLLKHPNTITVHDYGETEDGFLYLVTEFLEGETLYERLWRRGPMSQETTIHVSKQIAKSLAEAHDIGIIHGDLKPANIFLCNLYGERDFVKVLDFGITKMIGEIDPAGLGTPEYMSPEQFSGQPLLAASDVYSLGLLMYEMAVGKRPFTNEDTQKLAKHHLSDPLPLMLQEIERSPLGYLIRKTCAKEPANRYKNGWAVFQALDQIDGKLLVQRGSKATGPNSNKLVHVSRSNQPLELREAPEGKTQSVSVPSLAVSGLRPPTPSTSRGTQQYLPMVGRQRDRDSLLTQVQHAVWNNTSQWILLGGAAGIGKSRLASWLVREASLPDGVLTGSGTFRDGSPLPMEGIAEALIDLLGLSPVGEPTAHHSPTDIEEALEQFFNRDLEPDEQQAIRTLFGQLVVEGVSLDVMPVALLLEELSRQAPILLHLDNLQEMDPNAMDLLEIMAERAPDHDGLGLILVGAVRREDLPTVPDLAEHLMALQHYHPNARAHTLTAMKPDEAKNLARLTFVLESSSRDINAEPLGALLEQIATRSHGNPRYIIHLIQHLFDSNKLIQDGDQLLLASDIDLDALIPPRLAGFFRLRIAQMTHRHEAVGNQLKFLLLRCALLGRSAPRGLIEAYFQLEAQSFGGVAELVLIDLDNLLSLVEQEDILVPEATSEKQPDNEQSFIFTQPLLHQLLAERVYRTDKVEKLHQLAARAKKGYYQNSQQLSAHVDDIGRHYHLAGVLRESISFRLTAARACALNGQVDKVIHLLEEAIILAKDDQAFAPNWLRMIIALGYYKLEAGHMDELDALLFDGLDLSEALQDKPARAELTWLAARHATQTGPLAKAGRIIKQAREQFEALTHVEDNDILTEEETCHDPGLFLLSMRPLPRNLGVGLAWLDKATIKRERSLLEACDQSLIKAREIFDQIGFAWGVARCFIMLSNMVVEIGQARTALRLLDRTEKYIQQKTTTPDTKELRLMRSKALVNLGRLDEALAITSALLKEFTNTGRVIDEARCYVIMAAISDRRHQNDAATSYFQRSIELLQQHGDGQVLVSTQAEFGRYLLRRHKNDLERAHKLLIDTMETARSRQSRRLIPRLHLLMGALQLERGQYHEAKSWFGQCIELATDLGDPIRLIEANAFMAQLYHFRDAPMAQAMAIEHLETAIREARQVQYPMEEILRAEEIIALAWLREGSLEKAKSLLASARKGWQRMGNAREVQRLEAMIEPNRLKVDP